jgi:hypothetical protein
MPDKITVDILQRLERVEAAIAGIGGGLPLGPPISTDLEDEAQDRRLSTAAVAKRYGVSVRSVERWLRKPKLKFPQPEVVVNSRRYWWLSTLRAWDRERLRQSGRES